MIQYGGETLESEDPVKVLLSDMCSRHVFHSWKG
jgi:hypothetical protein